jgi:hypothetical protein
MGARAAFLPNGLPAAAKLGVVFAGASGSTRADILTYDGTDTPGAAISNSEITADSSGLLPQFWYPDGVDRVWIEVNGGPRIPIDAENRRRVTALATQVAGLGEQLTDQGEQVEDLTTAVAGKLALSGGTLTGTLTLADGSPAASRTWVQGNGGGGGGGAEGVLFDVEDYGAVGNGSTDDYAAFAAAWAAMLASPFGGRLFLPRAVEYRIDASVPGRLAADSGGAYALFRLPVVAPDAGHPKRRYGILGVGAPYAPRTAPFSGGSGAQTMTSSVMKVTYSTPFSWSATYGLPSIVGAPDADKAAGPAGNPFWFTNLHFTVDAVTIRQPDNPSLCALNLESVSTAEIGEAAFDVDVSLNAVSEPTHPTGCALLLPRVMNNVTVTIDKILAQGHYAGVPWVEHVDVRSATVLRCKIAVHFRRLGYHFGHITAICIEQCPWGFAGYDPSAAGPNLGVAPIPAECVLKADFVDFEDTTIDGDDWMYPPTKGAHVYDPTNKLRGQMTAARNDVGGVGLADSMWVHGGANFSIFGLMNFDVDGSARLNASAHAPSNPATSAPNAPTIGAATGGDASASVAFTAASSGDPATSYTATSTPGSLTGTGSSSPIAVSGLTNGVAYTFKVKATNAAGTSAESAASNSVTPASSGGGGSTTLVSDSFNRTNGPLGNADTSQAWTAGSDWSISGNRALFSSILAGGSYAAAVVDAGAANVTVTADLTLNASGGDHGLAVRYADLDNFVYIDISGSDGAGWSSRTFERIGGTFTGVTTLTTLTGASSAAPLKVKVVASGSTVTVSYDAGSGFVEIGSFTNAVGLRTNTKHGLVSESGQLVSLFDNFLVVG